MNIQNFLLTHIQQICQSTKIGSLSHLLTVKPATHTRFGDYQINGLITISKQLNVSVETLANEFIKLINYNNFAEIVKFEKPGFINIFLHSKWIENQINYIITLFNFGIITDTPQTVIVDYSSPNIAKEMHVGHLRSTVIGDSVVRILSFLGHRVIKSNHIGDWGTQFGMIIAHITTIKNSHNFSLKTIRKLSVLESFYQEAKKKYDNDPVFAQLARNYVVKLQKGDRYCQKLWKYLVNISVLNNQKLYQKLNITLKTTDIKGESAYQNMLPGIIKDLVHKKIAITSKNAIVVPIQHAYCNKYKKAFGVIIQKQDGGYLYSTTDIACIKYRCETLQANRIIYYTDSRQKQHLTQIYKIAKLAGYITESTLLEHHVCGMLLNKDGKPFKTRSGDALKLTTLLNEAFNRARQLIYNKNPKLNYNKLNKLADIISIGSIKYAELSKNRITNYIFNWNNILNFDGNTALYIQYAYTRIFSIFKKLNRSKLQDGFYHIQVHTKEERSLAICLLQFHETINTVAIHGIPHVLCAYLYKLSVLFSSFYEFCPILTENNIYVKCSRLQLALLTAHILKKGLNLLGIRIPEYL